MSVNALIIGGLLLGLWIVALNSFRLRNWRATTLGVLGTLAIVVAGALPWPAAPLLQIALWTAVLWVFLFRSELVAVMSQSEYQFVEQFVDALHSVALLKRRVRKTDAAPYIAQFETALNSLERLDAPDEWKQLQIATVSELRRRLTRMKLHSIPSADEQQAAEARWLEVEQQFSRMLTIRAGFWKGLPCVSRRS